MDSFKEFHWQKAHIIDKSVSHDSMIIDVIIVDVELNDQKNKFAYKLKSFRRQNTVFFIIYLVSSPIHNLDWKYRFLLLLFYIKHLQKYRPHHQINIHLSKSIRRQKSDSEVCRPKIWIKINR